MEDHDKRLDPRGRPLLRSGWPALAGTLAIGLGFLIDVHHAGAAVDQAWPAFVLVLGLLMIGVVLGADGVFEFAAAWLARLPGPAVALLACCYALVALVTAVLNLDTAAIFLTPVLIGVARERSIKLEPFLYGSIFMANASSLLLPASNLTNLLVLSHSGVSGGRYLTGMLAMSLSAASVTAFGLLFMYRGELSVAAPRKRQRPRATPRLGLVGASAAAASMLLLANPAVPVLAIGLALLIWRAFVAGIEGRAVVGQLGPAVLIGLFGASVALGSAARSSSLHGIGLAHAGTLQGAWIAALCSVLVNNLPAAVLLSSTRVAHPAGLLLGLAIGPNLAITGSLSALLWWRAASAAGARPSAIRFSRHGLVLAPLASGCALAMGALFGASP
jgi:arsenical pump membrane protein